MNLENLKSWQPGQSGNPKGRPTKAEILRRKRIKHLKKYGWQKGQSGNPQGRPKGKANKVHTNSLKNLIKWQAGQSGNPKGRPKKDNFWFDFSFKTKKIHPNSLKNLVKWQPGQSGNLKGRPVKSLNIWQLKDLIPTIVDSEKTG